MKICVYGILAFNFVYLLFIYYLFAIVLVFLLYYYYCLLLQEYIQLLTVNLGRTKGQSFLFSFKR